ncbi:MAG: hypothetical protein P4M08_13790 [Oligoflexia bacterium]|nr:hypothetical protein [Oligoflexia bacterium]
MKKFRMTRNWAFSTLLSVSTVGALMVGCNDSGTMATTSPSTGNQCLALDKVSYLSGAEQTCCCNGTTAINPAPATCAGASFTCPVGPAGVAETAGTLSDAAQAYNSGQSGLTAAGQMLSTSSPTNNSAAGQTGQASAATAGGSLGTLGSTTSSTPSAASLGNALGAGSGGLAGGGSGSSPATTGSSGLNSLAGLSPAATPSSVPGANGLLASAGSGSGSGQGLYAAGGGGGGGMGGGLFGGSSDSTSPGGAKGDVKDLSSGRSPASADVMGSADPIDYFTRLNSSDNLFKIVERRYTSKSRQWAVSDAQALSGSVKVLKAVKK